MLFESRLVAQCWSVSCLLGPISYLEVSLTHTLTSANANPIFSLICRWNCRAWARIHFGTRLVDLRDPISLYTQRFPALDPVFSERYDLFHIFAWTASQSWISATISQLRARKQRYKLTMFTRLYRILLITVVIIAVFFVISSLSFSDRLAEGMYKSSIVPTRKLTPR